MDRSISTTVNKNNNNSSQYATTTTNNNCNNNTVVSGSSPSTFAFLERSSDDSFLHLASFYQSGLFTDLTITCQGSHFRCHRIIMASVSPYIRDRLIGRDDHCGSGCQHCLTIDELPAETMQSILNCIYHGRQLIGEEQLRPISTAITFLRLHGINITIKPQLPNSTSATSESSSMAKANDRSRESMEDDKFCLLNTGLLNQQYSDNLAVILDGDDDEFGDDDRDELEEGAQLPSTKTFLPPQSPFVRNSATTLEPYATITLPDGKSKPMYQCHICGLMRSSKYILNRHVKYAHKPEKDIACALCSSNFKYPSCLKRHVQTIHKLNMNVYKKLINNATDQFQQQLIQQVQQIRHQQQQDHQVKEEQPIGKILETELSTIGQP